ncbi:hypothetical protein BKP45_14095 [Anaerobacillus alkalidiazotrophicus]|uniref:Uncharacterized protein n=1 Tax=Anaerobacillus alkalidiazotrophicus TaxID=472963 RepID=A0A1S2M3J4_9BACI|nr:hypothetical protein [Anaerobacillus alkalidiazotrophicus]OIJ19281.1 hypothetical protein BKP45_14095 [Anaerobacillus alkalidiazotrophicus]
MDQYKIKHMIIDDHFDGQEYVTADFSYNNKDYSVTFNKSDLETINTWLFEENKSIPAHLSESVIDAIRDDVRKRI